MAFEVEEVIPQELDGLHHHQASSRESKLRILHDEVSEDQIGWLDPDNPLLLVLIRHGEQEEVIRFLHTGPGRTCLADRFVAIRNHSEELSGTCEVCHLRILSS